MRIAEVSPLYESVPPHFYGGTERVVSFLTEELVSLGHDVTLFASGDSITSAQLVACSPQSLRLDPKCVDQFAHHAVQLDQVVERWTDYDVIHFHTDYLHFGISKAYRFPSVTTLHGRLDIPDLRSVYRRFPDMPVVSISYRQREPLPWLRWTENVYHGLPKNLFALRRDHGDYLAFLGRISPEKRPDRAIQIAQKAGLPLRIAAKIDKVDEIYYREQIEPLLGTPGVEFIGEITDSQKEEFLGNALAYVFPIDWPEPFGLTMIEAMACGTPTIAFRHGSVSEILEHGVTGFIVESVDEAAAAIQRVKSLDRAICRGVFEQRFTAQRMAEDYLKVYETVADEQLLSAPPNAFSS